MTDPELLAELRNLRAAVERLSMGPPSVTCQACNGTGKTWGIEGHGFQVCVGCKGAGVHRL